jgi:hypothetical protein
MSCTSTTQRTELTSRLAKKREQLTAVQDAIDELIPQNIEEYQLGTGEMYQRARRRKLSELRELEAAIEADIDALVQRLGGCGIVNMNLRRMGF